jgi:cytochrome b subunit of formate dehydrogenase
MAAAAPAAVPQPLTLQGPKDNAICLGCHSIPGAVATRPGGKTVSITVSQAELSASAHPDLSCTDCHQDVTQVPHGTVAPVRCQHCHYVSEIVTTRIPGQAPQPRYLSPHRSALMKGNRRAPRCADCHGAHDVQPASVRGSRAGRAHIAGTCGTCHPSEAGRYAESVHGRALANGNPDVPVCSDCHPEHRRDVHEGRIPGIVTAGIVATCVACHDDPGLQHRYAIPAGRLASYLGSYHGAATQLGESRTANCASCHSAHLILPARDPRSSVNKANLQRTCGKCHPRAGLQFAVGTVHLLPSPSRERALFWIKVAYQVFIGGLILSFVGYIGLDLLARLRKRITAPPRPAEAEPHFERLTLNQRIQHWLLIASFITLLVTGLPLSFPQSLLARTMVTFLGGMGARAIIHRAAALLLIALVAYHLHYALLSRRGNWELRQLVPRPRDALNVLQMLRFYFGLSTQRPRFDRYNYIEKFEYLAVGWGSVVMIASGALLWTPSLSALAPKWMMDIALVVHSWEAIMAFLAIIVWHMYNVHSNPSVFPMSRIWLTGKIGLSELQENHPLEYERLIARARNVDAEDEEDEAAVSATEKP